VVYAVSLGLLQATTVRMARAKDPAGQQVVATTGLALAGGAALLVCTGVALAAGPLAGSAMTFEVLLLLAVSELFGPIAAASSGLLRGLKITRPPMLFSLLGNWAVAAPLGIWLTEVLGLGSVGVWIGLALGTKVAALLTFACLLRVMRPRTRRSSASRRPGRRSPAGRRRTSLSAPAGSMGSFATRSASVGCSCRGSRRT